MRVPFFRVAERKEPKKGRPHCLRPLRFATGQPVVLGFGGVSLELAPFHFAQTIASPDPPNPALLGASRGAKGTEHPHGPLLRCAALGPNSRAQAPRAAQAKPSAAMARMDVRLFGCLAPHPCWLRLRRGGCGVSMGVEAPMLRELTRRGCLNEAATQRSEFHGAPRNRPAAGLPLRTAKGSQTGGRLSFGYFSLAKQRKVPRPPGRNPGSRPWQRHAAKRMATNQTTIKSVAASAYLISARATKHIKTQRLAP